MNKYTTSIQRCKAGQPTPLVGIFRPARTAERERRIVAKLQVRGRAAGEAEPMEETTLLLIALGR